MTAPPQGQDDRRLQVIDHKSLRRRSRPRLAASVSRFTPHRRLPIENTCTEGQIDAPRPAVNDGPMSEVISAAPRRSARAFQKIRVQARGRTHDRKKFKETCETVVVSAHGGLLLLKHEVDDGEMLVLTNPLTQEEQECRVVYRGEPMEKGQRVGIEFLTPAPRFWGVEFQTEPSSAKMN